ncbi:MAG: ADP-ribosylglycohydrolase family protein [Armatimonadota bacterium]
MSDLCDKFLGCIAACHIGSAMGAAVEGWPYSRIEETYGTLNEFQSYEHYGNGWKREPGTTEDGVERQKLIITAIIEKGDRVTAEDVRRIWLRDIKPESIGMVSEPFEAELLAVARSCVPAREIGRYCDYAGLVTFSRSCHPVALINAGDVHGAVADIREVGQLYHTANSRAIRWAEAVGIAVASATAPHATLADVISAVLEHSSPDVSTEIRRALSLVDHCRDFRELRSAFDAVYGGHGIPYAQSYANEVVSKAFAVLKLTGGRPKDAIIAAVNFGRDTDCLASVAGGISGALSGASSIPEHWISQLDRATKLNPYTNSQRTLRETADGLYQAFRSRLANMKRYVELMEKA